MKPQSARKRVTRKLGFTLIELMMSLLILGVLMGAVFRQMDTAQQRMSTESIKLDDFQQARDFVDQFFRDINQIGDPNSRMFDLSSVSFLPANPLINDNRFAVGLTEIDQNEIHFEGSVNGIGTVQSVIYKINGTGLCALCLQRSQVDKVLGDPLTAQTPNWGTEVNDVIVTPIFSYFLTDGTQVTTLPVDYTSAAGANTLANVKTIKLSLVIRNPAVLDIKTGQPIETNFEGEVSLNNCSMVANGQPMSCN